jgi:hypothetical protein
MWKRPIHLVSAALLFTIAGYFILFTARECKKLWQREVAATIQEVKSTQTDAPEKVENDLTEAARLKMYGVLNQPETVDPKDAPVLRPRPNPPAGLDRVNPSPAGAPRRFVHGRFSVKSYQGFAFDVPPHATHPRVQGSFRVFASDGTASTMDVLLLSREEFDAFIHRGLGAATFSLPDSDGGDIDWVLNPTFLNPQRSYLVFNNASGRPQLKRVQADFTVSFE